MKKNKKSRISRILFAVLLFTLVSSVLMSGTMAKYVTRGEDDNKDFARVAKWGVEINSTSPMGLFAEEYIAGDADGLAGDYFGFTGSHISVSSSNGDNLVAPGTTNAGNEFLGIGITGTPEVACHITLKFDKDKNASKLAGWNLANGEAYEPVVWTVQKFNSTLPAPGLETILDKGTFDDMLDLLEDIDIYVEPNTDLSTLFNGSDIIKITWEWPFSISDDNDKKDTYLGDQAALGNAATFTIAYDQAIQVVQVD